MYKRSVAKVVGDEDPGDLPWQQPGGQLQQPAPCARAARGASGAAAAEGPERPRMRRAARRTARSKADHCSPAPGSPLVCNPAPRAPCPGCLSVQVQIKAAAGHKLQPLARSTSSGARAATQVREGLIRRSPTKGREDPQARSLPRQQAAEGARSSVWAAQKITNSTDKPLAARKAIHLP